MIIIQSFGFKKSGIPSNSNLVFDVRSLRNPHDVEKLRELDGRDSRVMDYVTDDEKFTHMLHNILLAIDMAKRENDLVVSIGCTGGRHRSVVMAEHLATYLGHKYGATVNHLELG